MRPNNDNYFDLNLGVKSSSWGYDHFVIPSHFYLKRGHILHIFRYAPDVSEHWVEIEFSGKFISWAICLVLLSISKEMLSISILLLPLSFLIFDQSYMILMLLFLFIDIYSRKILHATYIQHTCKYTRQKCDKTCRKDVWTMYDQKSINNL